ncbi:sodium-independent sulfate anion transporter isoform X2 [Cephus cinctus]|uniref:Sodium-independent sulfate anion transporter isoform X2 n=1 Tax=Cephus cinctus TaxID=211228 RepID=A0AAJ7RTY1_CEPCN|nr:sodium-independent sulfate anion transporter isoform X2 [Cephus cinctus]
MEMLPSKDNEKGYQENDDSTECAEECESVGKKATRKYRGKSIKNYISIIQWLPRYTKFEAISDLVAGITLGLTMIPQSIAYAALAGLSAQYGLYSCLFGGFIYVVFGTVKEVSIGATSLMALLTIQYTSDMPVDFVLLLTFLAGCIELAMGLLNLGFLVDFISMPVTSGFTSATSIIIIASQMQGLLGLKYKFHSVPENLYKLFKNFGSIRIGDTILGISCIIFLMLARKVKDLTWLISKGNKNGSDNNILKKALWFFSISRNAVIVLVTAVISYYIENDNGHVPFILSGKVMPGLPKITLPPFSSQSKDRTYNFIEMVSHLGTGIIVLPLIAVLANIAIAKAFASGKRVNASQEMFTLGLCNIVGSFAGAMPTCGAFTRSAVSNASGVATPFAGIYSTVVFMIDWRIVSRLWKGSKKDVAAALGTFVVCLVFDVETGLLLGILINCLHLLYLSARPSIQVTQCKSELGYKYLLIKPDIGLFYPAVDFLCTQVMIAAKTEGRDKLPIVIDCDRFKGIDYTAAKGFERLLKDFSGKNQELLFLRISPKIFKRIQSFGVDITKFKHADNESSMANILYGDELEMSRSATLPVFKCVDE